MLLSALVAFLHFTTALLVVSMILFEALTFTESLTMSIAKRIQQADMIYLISALLVVAIGFLRVYYFEKGSAYYFSNWLFWVKIGSFIAVGLLSIYPTIKFIKWGKELKENKPPKVSLRDYTTISLLLKIELIGIIIMLISASFMAKGYGFL